MIYAIILWTMVFVLENWGSLAMVSQISVHRGGGGQADIFWNHAVVWPPSISMYIWFWLWCPLSYSPLFSEATWCQNNLGRSSNAAENPAAQNQHMQEKLSGDLIFM